MRVLDRPRLLSNFLLGVTLGVLATGTAAQAPDSAARSELAVPSSDAGTAREASSPAGADALPLEDVAALLKRAGRSVPPGLTVAQRSAREADAQAALQELRGRLEADASWSAALGTLLGGGDLVGLPEPDSQAEATPEPSSGAAGHALSGLPWSAVARATAALLASPSAPAIPGAEARLGAALEGPEPERTAAAEALYRVFGLWFESAAEFETFHATLCSGAGTERLLVAQRAAQAERRELLRQLLPLDPGRARDLLDHPDSQLRSAAARSLGSTLAPDSIELLFARLAIEPRVAVQAALCDALLDVLSSEMRADFPGLRERLLDSIERLVRDEQPDAGLFLAKALARIAGERPIASPGELARGPGRELRLLAELLEPIAGRTADALDVDLSVGMLDSVQAQYSRLALAHREEGRPASAGEVDVVRLPVYALYQDAEQPEAVRLAALRAYASLAEAEHLPRLIDALCRKEGQRLSFAALGALQPMTAELDPASEDGDRLLACVVALLSEEDAVLRRRALSFLTAPSASGGWVDHVNPNVLKERLDDESQLDLRQALLGLLKRFGGPELPSLLELESFDELASTDPKTLADLTETLLLWSGDDAGKALDAARKLAGDGTAAARLQRALELVAQLSQASAESLEPSDHLQILVWTDELRVSGLDLVDVVPSGIDRGSFVERLIGLHIEASASAAPGAGPAQRRFFLAALNARLRAERWKLTSDSEGVRSVLAGFDAAFSIADEDPVAELESQRLRRDRARFLRIVGGREEGARKLYRELLEREQGPDAVRVLQLSDLRAAAELIAHATPGGQIEPAEALEAFGVGRIAIERDDWAAEPASARLRDLTRLVDWAIAAGTEATLEYAAGWLGADPEDAEADGEGKAAPAAAGGAGFGPERAGELARLRERVQAAQVALSAEAQGPPPAPVER